jgi:hypothetical protein
VPRQLVLDQGRDLDGRRLYRLVSIYGAPDWVKSASVDEICGNQIPAHLYADPAAHLYPTHTKAATWASLAFFLDNRAAFPLRHAEIVLDRLVKAARFQGIGAYADELIAKSAELNRHDDARLTDDAFAYVASGPDGPIRRLRVINPLEVKAAAEWLHRHRDEIAYPDRQKIARRVLVKAAEFGVGLGEHDDFLEKTAGFGGCSCAQAVATVRQRVTLARHRHGDIAAGLEKLAAQLEADPADTRRPDTLSKLAHTLEQADRILRVEYGGKVQRPEDVLFSLTRKAASALAAGHILSPSGTVYATGDLGRLRVKQLRDHMGDEVADGSTSDGIHVDPEKLAELLPTFTRGDAEMFDLMVRKTGVVPQFKEAALHRQGLTRDDLEAFAAAHLAGH